MTAITRWGRWLLVLCLLASGARVLPRFQAAHGLRFQPSIEQLETAIRQVPDDPGHHFRLGVVYRDLPAAMDLERSRTHLERAAELHPLNWRYRRELALLHELSGRRLEAEQSYLESIRLNPGSADYRWRLAHFYARTGSLDQALPHFRAALDADPVLRRIALPFLFKAGATLAQVEAAWPASETARQELFQVLCRQPDVARRAGIGDLLRRLRGDHLAAEPPAGYDAVDSICTESPDGGVLTQ